MTRVIEFNADDTTGAIRVSTGHDDCDVIIALGEASLDMLWSEADELVAALGYLKARRYQCGLQPVEG